MNNEIWLLITGGMIGFLSSLITLFVTYFLEGKRLKRQWEREDSLRRKESWDKTVESARTFHQNKFDEIVQIDERGRIYKPGEMPRGVIKKPAILRDPKGEFCFVKGTKINLSNEEQVNIEEIKIGSTVSSYDVDKKQIIHHKVTGISLKKQAGYLVVNEKLRITSSHWIYANERWLRAGDLRIGDNLFQFSGNYIDVSKIEFVEEEVIVYNLDLENNFPFFAESFLVSTMTAKNIGF